MKPKISFLLTLFLFIVCASLFSQENKLTLNLCFEKTVYNYSELIVARVKYLNKDTIPHSISYNCSLENDIADHLIFKDDYGIPNRDQSSFIVDCAGDHITILPGETYESYGAPMFADHYESFSVYLEPGNYSVFMKGSDTVKLEILNDTVNDYHKIFQQISGIEDKYDRFIKWKEFLYDSRNRSYLNLAYIGLTSLHKNYNKNYSQMNIDMLFLFGANPDAWYTDVLLFHYCFLLKDYFKQGKKMFKFLQKIVKKYPGTRVGYLADKILMDKKIPVFSF